MTTRDLEQFIGDPADLRDPAEGVRARGRLGRVLNDFDDLVRATVELVRSQIPQAIPPERRLEGISVQAGRLLQEAGLVSSVDEGIVVFHDRITRDKPGLRAILRKSDRRAGRLTRVKRTLAQRTVTEAFKAGMVLRSRDGRIKGLTSAAIRLVRKAKAKQRAQALKALRKRQATARKRLTKGLATRR